MISIPLPPVVAGGFPIDIKAMAHRPSVAAIRSPVSVVHIPHMPLAGTNPLASLALPRLYGRGAVRGKTMNDMNDDSFSTTTVAAGQLRAIIERIENLEEERKEIADQIKEVYAEAKGNGFDTKTLRKVIQLRRRSTEERQEIGRAHV